MKKIFFVVVAIFTSTYVLGQTITVPLPGLTGPVGSHPNWTTTSFDAGVYFSQIQEVRFQCSGTMTQGIAQEGGLLGPPITFAFDGAIEIFMDPGPGLWFLLVSPDHIANNTELIFDGAGSPSWDFLLDGNAQITANMIGDTFGIDVVTIVPATAEITDALLIIEGTVIPEPASILLFTAGVFLIRKKY